MSTADTTHVTRGGEQGQSAATQVGAGAQPEAAEQEGAKKKAMIAGAETFAEQEQRLAPKD